MKTKIRRILVVSVSLLVLFSLILAAGLALRFESAAKERFFDGTAEEYYLELISKGFPEDYASALTELHLLHPNWSFVPLQITETNKAYTWDYVITQETKNPKTNLIGKSDSYAAYRHPTNTELYDAGYYQASIATVSYFMDPRNFLNETDIFQFYDLNTHTEAEMEEVKAVLAGTFMENAVLENGMTYAAYFCEISQELGINPVYLAAKVRQEQGNGTSPVIKGSCGSLLADYYINQTQTTDTGKQILPPASGHSAEELQALDGYYNAFNVKASGTGLFSIYYNAMTRAKAGTESMAAKWGGDPSWNTLWKSLYGGSAMIKTSYIDRYQSTVYLQKFNVDGRAADRNFWGQYMQNVSGALTESRSLYSAFASVGALDSACVFLIPVYEGMPKESCKDPADGSCTLLAQATNRYTYTVKQTKPQQLIADGYPIYKSLTLESGSDLKLSLEATHDYGVVRLEYSLDGGEWISPASGGKLELVTGSHFSPASQHILVVRGIADYNNEVASKKQNYAFLCGVYYIDVLSPKHEITFVSGTGSKTELYTGGGLMLPECADEGFVGWIGSDGSFLPAGATVTPETDLTYTAQTLAFHKLYGAALSLSAGSPTLRFSAVMETKGYKTLSQQGFLRICARQLCEGKETDAAISQLTIEKDWVKVDTDTLPLTDFADLYTADFYVELLYTDQTVKQVYADGEKCARSVHTVAAAALADKKHPYTQEELSILKKLLPQ